MQPASDPFEVDKCILRSRMVYYDRHRNKVKMLDNFSTFRIICLFSWLCRFWRLAFFIAIKIHDSFFFDLAVLQIQAFATQFAHVWHFKSVASTCNKILYLDSYKAVHFLCLKYLQTSFLDQNSFFNVILPFCLSERFLSVHLSIFIFTFTRFPWDMTFFYLANSVFQMHTLPF